MIHIITALPAEAKPLIRYFKLESVESDPFKVYEQGVMRLAVSGPGEENMMRCVKYLFNYAKMEKNSSWINIGIAGHPDLPIGSLVLANEIMRKGSELRRKTVIRFENDFYKSALITVREPEKEYLEDALYDMEGAAFYETAIQHSKPDLVQCVKVVSDNSIEDQKKISGAFVQTVLESKVEDIDKIARNLQKIEQEIKVNARP